jgi:hypothetical protein
MSVDTAIKTGFLYFGKRKTSRVGTPLSQLTLRVQSIAKAFFPLSNFFSDALRMEKAVVSSCVQTRPRKNRIERTPLLQSTVQFCYLMCR